jgi:hypothetical protein
MQITPVVVPVEVPVVVPVTTCAATGDVAKSSAVINASFFMCALVLRWSITDQAMRTGLRGPAQPRRPITGSLSLAFALHFYSGQPLQNLSDG